MPTPTQAQLLKTQAQFDQFLVDNPPRLLLAGFLAFRVLKAGQSNGAPAYRQHEPAFPSQQERFGQRASEFHGA